MAKVFNKKDQFKRECDEILTGFKVNCTLSEVPFYFEAVLAEDKDGNKTRVAEGLFAGSMGMKLNDDHLNRHLLVFRGFDVIGSRNDLEVRQDDPDSV